MSLFSKFMPIAKMSILGSLLILIFNQSAMAQVHSIYDVKKIECNGLEDLPAIVSTPSGPASLAEYFAVEKIDPRILGEVIFDLKDHVSRINFSGVYEVLTNNLGEGAIEEIEVGQFDEKYYRIGSLVRGYTDNGDGFVFGNGSLLVEKERIQTLGKNGHFKIVLMDMGGNIVEQDMNCRLFY